MRHLTPVALLGLALAASAAASPPPGCAPAGAQVLARSGGARIYSLGKTLYGCLGARRTRLGALAGTPASPATRVTRHALASPYAGVGTFQMGVDTSSSTVALVDLRTGAKVVTSPAATPPPRPESFITVTQLAVNHDGVLAWASRSSAIGLPHPTYALHVLEHGQARVEATATRPIVGLTLTTSTVAWRDDHTGRAHHLPLRP